MKRLEAEKESLRIKAEQEECCRLRMVMEHQQKDFDKEEARRREALRIHSERATKMINDGCFAMNSLKTLDIAGDLERDRLAVNLDFIDEMITRCDRAQEVEWIEQDTDSEEEVNIDG